MITSISDLKNYINDHNYEFVIICGYDNVGKGFITNALFEDIPVFHPDYSLICNTVDKSGRWTFFMYFLDMYQQLKPSIKLNAPLVFDRSSLCGSVYNKDPSIAKEYCKRLKGINVLHILVTVPDKDTYIKLFSVRNNNTKLDYESYLTYTERYRNYMELLDIPYVEFVNNYNEELGSYMSKVCGGCTHYKSGLCTNKNSGIESVSFDTERCSYSSDKEVQDE